MLKRFRRTSKVKTPSKSQDTTSPATFATQSQSNTQTNFFSLPAELRNDIYDLAARASTLHLFNPSTTTKSKLKPIPALLLASRQTRNEYLPILLSIATIKASITDFNFKALQSLLSSLYSTELKALRCNDNLILIFRLRKCNDDAYPNLRRWCTDRATSLDKITFRYEIDKDIPPKVQRWYAERSRVLYGRVESESIKWEVRRVSEALEGEIGPWMRSVVATGAGVELEREQVGEGWIQGFGDDFVMMAAARRRRE